MRKDNQIRGTEDKCLTRRSESAKDLITSPAPSLLHVNLGIGAAIAFAVVLTFATHISFAQSASTDRQPVPKLTPQVMAERKIKQKYKDQYAAKDNASRLSLAHSLREAARDLRAQPPGDDDVGMRFVLLREARELAVDAGDFHFAMRIVDDIGRNFAVNPTDMKLSALSAGVDKAGLPPAEVADAYIRAADDFVEVNDLDSARRTMILVHTVERNVRGEAALKQRTIDCEKRIADARRNLRDVIAANQKLKTDPDNAALNQAVGQYLCTIGNWDQGLPMLAKGSDVALRTLAAKDLAAPTDPGAAAELGDAWWAAESSKSFRTSAVKRRAIYWYQKALPSLTGDKKAATEKRIAEIEER